jgi:hypothetical protein
VPYYVNDVPSEPLVIEPESNGDAIDISAYIDADVKLVRMSEDDDGELYPEPVVTSGFAVDVETDTVVIEWPGDSPFPEVGLYRLTVVLLGGAGERLTLAPLWLAAQADNDGWHNLDTARGEWKGAPRSDYYLWQLLDLAKRAVIEFAPDLGKPRPPFSWSVAQLMQARNIWNAATVDSGGALGDDEGSFVIRPYPLDWAIRQQLRPKRALGAVG